MTKVCSACGRHEGEPINDECWPCQSDPEADDAEVFELDSAEMQPAALREAARLAL